MSPAGDPEPESQRYHHGASYHKVIFYIMRRMLIYTNTMSKGSMYYCLVKIMILSVFLCNHYVINTFDHTVCPRSSFPFYVVTYYIIWVPTPWTDSIPLMRILKFWHYYYLYRKEFIYRTSKPEAKDNPYNAVLKG